MPEPQGARIPAPRVHPPHAPKAMSNQQMIPDGLLDRADELDSATDDIVSLVEMMGHDVDPVELRRLLAMAYAVGSADGRLHEFEDDLIWRMGRLFGFDDAE